MREAQPDDPSFWLKPKQIMGFFGRLSAQLKTQVCSV
jgi:hypothetical protein